MDISGTSQSVIGKGSTFVAIYGFYIRSWLVAIIVGLIAAFIFLRIVDLTPAGGIFKSPLMLPALSIIFGFVIWAVFFKV